MVNSRCLSTLPVALFTAVAGVDQVEHRFFIHANECGNTENIFEDKKVNVFQQFCKASAVHAKVFVHHTFRKCVKDFFERFNITAGN